MIYKNIFPTSYPLFDFYLRIWTFQIGTEIMRQSMDSDTYEYIRIRAEFRGNKIFEFRLFDTYKRQEDRLGGIYVEAGPFTLKRLNQIKKTVDEEIAKIKNSKKI